jgi:hypothetical protein
VRKLLGVVLKTLLGIVAAVVLAAAGLTIAWLVRREDPAAFLPADYVAYLQVPSLRIVYDDWLNLEAADVVLARPDLAAYRSVVADVRGLALTRSPLLRTLLDVRADVVLLKGGRLVAVLDLGWRGIASPLARLVAPQLGVKGFSFLNDAGTPMYRYTTGTTTIHAAIVNNVAVVSLDPEAVKASLSLRRTDTGLAAEVGRDLLRRIHLRTRDGLRILVDARSLSTDLLAPTPLGARILDAVEVPGQSMLDVRLARDRLDLGATMPVTIALPALAKAAAAPPPTLGVLRLVPSRATVLSVSNIAPLSQLYAIAAGIQGKDVQDIHDKADSGARSVLGMGIDQLLFSWIGTEVGAFMLPSSAEPVFFARISDEPAWEASLHALTTSAVASRDSSLVLDSVRLDRLDIPWYVTLVLDSLGVSAPDPYFLSKGGYVFLSLEPQNLAALAKAADTGDTVAAAGPWARLGRGLPANPSLLVWYDLGQGEPFFLRGAGLLGDILRLYARGAAAVTLGSAEVSVVLAAEKAPSSAARAVPGFPVAPEGGVAGDVLAFRFAGASRPSLAWVRGRDTVVLADAQGKQTAEMRLEPDITLVTGGDEGGSIDALWAVSASGTVWRLGPGLALSPSFPVMTGVTSTMPPSEIGGRLALFSRADNSLVLIGKDGTRTASLAGLEAPLLLPPDSAAGLMAFYPKSFDARVHLTDASGREQPGWPVSAAGISWCAPRVVVDAGKVLVTFLTQAGSLHAWQADGTTLPPFPVELPGVFYATPEPLSMGGAPQLAVLAQDGTLRLVSTDGSVTRQVTLEDVDGRTARLVVADLGGAPGIFIYAGGAYITGLDASLRPLPGFPVKGARRPQLVDLNRDGTLDLVTAGLDGRIYAYAVGRAGS